MGGGGKGGSLIIKFYAGVIPKRSSPPVFLMELSIPISPCFAIGAA